MFVLTSVIVTVAPGRTRPDVSVTLPTSEPLTAWALAPADQETTTARDTTAHTRPISSSYKISASISRCNRYHSTGRRQDRNARRRGAAMAISRRKFLSDAAITGAGLTIVPRRVLGRGLTAPSDRLNGACVGVGGQGRSDLVNLASENVVALCDVDWDYANKGFESLDREIATQQTRLADGVGEVCPPASARGEEPPMQKRPMTPLERERAAAQIANMRRLKDEHLPRAKRYQDCREMLDAQKDLDGVVIATPDHMHATIALAAMDLGKHVYVQKPLCWSVAEARALSKRAKETKVATQMGNQGHSWDEARTAVEYVWAGAIDRKSVV